jgi:subtilisin family serine protease
LAEQRALLSQSAAAAAGAIPIPLPAARATTADRQLGRRMLVGARSHAALPGLAALVRRLGARPRAIRSIAVVAATAADPARVAAALRRDPRVAYVERDPRLALAGDGDFPDPEHGFLNFSWAFDAVRAGPALAAAGGGSRRQVAVLDTGADVGHPDLAGRTANPFDTFTGGSTVRDLVGHGTFVAGLVSAVDGNGLGGKGVAGATTVFPIRASTTGDFTLGDVLRGLDFALERGADVINLSLAGDTFSESQARALAVVFFRDVLPVAASGNRALEGNPIEYPAAFIGGRRGAPGIGLSVAATLPNDQPADFSNHNEFVSLAAPGASFDCRRGVFSTVPGNTNSIWDEAPGGCNPPVSISAPEGRWGYGQGTSFSAPLAAGIAALVWQMEPELQSEQVGHVLIRSARQTFGPPGWNEFTGSGVVDGGAAVALAQVYDTDAPRARAQARRRGKRVRIRLMRAADRTDPGHELANRVRYSAAVSTDGGRSFRILKRSSRPFRTRLKLRGEGKHLVVAAACDGNNNCGVKRLGTFTR